VVESETSALGHKDMQRPDLASEIYYTAFCFLKHETLYVMQYLESKCEKSM